MRHIGISIFLSAFSILAAGCGGLTISRGRLQPLEAIVAAAPPRPCLGDVPERVKLGTLDGPEPVRGTDEEGNPISGMRFVVTTESAVKFFHWVEEIEKLARKARESCVAR